MTPGKQQSILAVFTEAFEQLTPESLATVLDCYDSQARFVDPFNDVTGSAAIERIFSDMFEQLHDPRFKVNTAFESFATTIHKDTQTNLATGHQAFITWDFYFRFASFSKNKQQTVHGSSHLVFSPAGKIVLHRDYWDAAHQFYEQFPLLGPVLRALRKRIAGTP